jgi:tetratricopeptide (TPR) repeat protein
VAIETAEREGRDFLNALARAVNGMRMFASGDHDGGVEMVESARRIQARIGDFEGGGVALSLLASMRFAGGDLAGALQLYGEAEVSFRTVGDIPEIARVQCEMGYAALAAENFDDARQIFVRAVRTYDEVGSLRGTGQALIGLAAVEAAAGNSETAVAIAAAAQVLAERAGVVVEHPMAPGVAEQIQALRESIPGDQLEQLLASGSALTPAEVLAMVPG